MRAYPLSVAGPQAGTASHLAPPDANSSDAELYARWIHGKSDHTKRSYGRSISRFTAFVRGKPLRQVALRDLQEFADSLTGEASSQACTLAAVRSLLSFAYRRGATVRDEGVDLKVPKARDTLADRILTEADVARMLALTSGRDHVLVRLAYASALRVSELVGLRWSDLADAPDGTLFATVVGKGKKTRTVRISAATATLVRALRGAAPIDAFVFAGRPGKPITATTAWRIVRRAARKAGIEKPVSPHFMRHSHATHALDRGASIASVRDTLGHSSIATTDRYLHARPSESSGLLLAV
jgi:integrase/recombinase XerD